MLPESRPTTENRGIQALSITKLNQFVNEALRREIRLQNIWIEGEITNYNHNRGSGHIYFSLKDDQSVMDCTFFKYANARYAGPALKDGTKILAKGGISTFPARGRVQFNIQTVMLAGEGALRLKIEELKQRLFKEGLFDPSRRRPLPAMVRTIGVATAPGGAAIQDIIRVARLRHPLVNILLAPCQVQGPEAPASVCEAIRLLNLPEMEVDVIIAGRGGGSFEDLLAFNDESVIRAFAASRVPIVSAVGHEIDAPLTDLAADAHAPTPSAAAQKVVFDFRSVEMSLERSHERLRQALRNRYRSDRDRLRAILRSAALASPRGAVQNRIQLIDDLAKTMRQGLFQIVQDRRMRFRSSEVIPVHYRAIVRHAQRSFAIASERLMNFGPLATLQRGYSIVLEEDGTVVRSISGLAKGARLEIVLSDGRASVTLDDTRPNPDARGNA